MLLWGCGYIHAYEKVLCWLNQWAIITTEKVSRCDIAVDVKMSLPDIDLSCDLVGRARKKEIISIGKHYSGLHPTGYSIGSGPIMARIYDKTAEVKVKHKEWFYNLWEVSGWHHGDSVTRFEFQLRREVLKEFSVDSFSDLNERLADMWRYCSVDWLSIRQPGKTKERDRWPVKPYWVALQNIVDYFGKTLGMLRYKQKQNKRKHIQDMLKGVMVTFHALTEQIYGAYSGNRQVKAELCAWLEASDYRLRVNKRKMQLANVLA